MVAQANFKIEMERIIQEKEIEHQKEKIELENDSKRLQDQLEDEVRKVLMENIVLNIA